ncbi:hypothetical protein BMG523Draft_02587 [Frankia sp. BMG5.23]|nr:hypothetical protein BMG523Draft_02587 [Frankia sp. BMG5.23]
MLMRRTPTLVSTPGPRKAESEPREVDDLVVVATHAENDAARGDGCARDPCTPSGLNRESP